MVAYARRPTVLMHEGGAHYGSATQSGVQQAALYRCVDPRPTGFGAPVLGSPVALGPAGSEGPAAPVEPVSPFAMRDNRIVPARMRNSSTSGSGSGISMFNTNSVPPIPMMVREPSLATTGMSTREVRKPMTSVCHGYRRLSAVNMARWPPLLAAALLLAHSPLAAVTEVMTDSDIAYAFAIANGSEASRALFHAPYRISVDDPLVEHLEIITEFRRFVIAAEEQLKAGNWMMARGGFDSSGRTLKDLLRPLIGQVSIRARLRFHPHNSYTTLPPFDILLGAPTLLAIDAIRTPHIVPSTGELGSHDVVTGATIEMFYNAPSIQDRELPVRLVSEGREFSRSSVNFSRLQ